MKTLLLVFLAGSCCILTLAYPRRGHHGGAQRRGQGHHGTTDRQGEPAHAYHPHDNHRGHNHTDHSLDQFDRRGHHGHDHESHGHAPGHHHGGHDSEHKRLMRLCAVCVRECRDTGETFDNCVKNETCKEFCYPSTTVTEQVTHNIGDCLICIRQCALDLEASTNPSHRPYKSNRQRRIIFCVQNEESWCHRPCHHFHGEHN